MGNEAADKFLTCVLRRTEKDRIMRLGSVALVVLLVPAAVFAFLLAVMVLLQVEIEIDPNDFAGIILLIGILEVFVVFRMVNSYYQHQLRDIGWTESLTEYAESYGHDSSKLRKISEEMVNNRAKIFNTVFGAFFLLVLVVNSFQAFFVSINTMTTADATLVAEFTSLMSTILLCVGGAYVFVCARKHDHLQYEYSTVWSELMKFDLRVEPMETGIKNRKLWPHIILMVVTLALYGYIFAIWSIHTMNVHISKQHTYEIDLLTKVMEKEGATGIEYVPKEYGKGLIGLVQRILF